MANAKRPLVFWLGFVFFVGWLTAPDFLREKERSEAGSFQVAEQRVRTDSPGRFTTSGISGRADPELVSPVKLRPVDPEGDGRGDDAGGIEPVVLKAVDDLEEVDLEATSGEDRDRAPAGEARRAEEADRRREAGTRRAESVRAGDGERPRRSDSTSIASGFRAGGATGTAPTGGAGAGPVADSNDGASQGRGDDPGPVASNDGGSSGGDDGGFEPAGEDPEDDDDTRFDPSVGGEPEILDSVLQAVDDVIRDVGGDPVGHGVILVNFSSSASGAEQREILRVLDPSGGEVFIPLTETFVVTLPELGDVPVVVDLLRGLPAVEGATPSRTFEPTGDEESREAESEPMFPKQWALRNLGLDGFPDADIDGPEGWSRVEGRRVPVGVIDTGFDLAHADMPQYVKVHNSPFSPGGIDRQAEHGTAVTGILAAPASNDVGIAGVNHSWIELYVAKAGDGDDGLSDQAVLDAVSHFALHTNVRVVNMSFAKKASAWPDLPASLVPVCRAIANAPEVLFVASAGNAGSTEPHYPAACPGDNVISVAASDAWDLRWSGSSYGVTVDVAAPGAGVFTLNAEGGYTELTGTSASAAVVSGVASLVLANDAALTPARVRDRVTSLTGTDQPAGLAVYGLSRVNACKALGGVCAYPGVP